MNQTKKQPNEKYKLRKKVINTVTAFSERIDDSLQSYKKETLILISKLGILLLTLIWLFIMIFAGRLIGIVLASIFLLTSFISYITHIGKWRMVKAMTQIKMMREKE